MRPNHSTIRPATLRHAAAKVLKQTLPWNDYGRNLTTKRLIDLIVLSAALGSSLAAVVRRFGFACSHETARQAIKANLAELPELTMQLLTALYQIGAKTLVRRAWVIAIDEHRVPFYGRRNTFGVTGGQKKHGTKYAFGYATAVLVHHRYRYTVGLIALTELTKPHQIVERLLEQVRQRGLQVRGVVLDSGKTYLLLQKQGLAYTIAMRRKGKTGNRGNNNWTLPTRTVTTIAWKTEKQSKRVSTQALVFQVRGEKHKRVYAFAGWADGPKRSNARRGSLARRWYRKRFGIETSYRPMRQCHGVTTTKNSRYRLLLIGLALMLRQVWGWLTARIAKAYGHCPTKWLSELTLSLMLEWLADWLKCKYKEPKVIPLSNQKYSFGNDKL